MIRISQAVQEKTSPKHLPHLTLDEGDGLVDFAGRLCQRYGPDLVRVVLFGSKARGDADNESDLDVLVVAQMSNNDYWHYWNEIVGIAWDIELAYNLVMSLVIKNEPEYVTMCERQSLLARNIERDGIELWTTQPNEAIFKPI